MKRLVFLVAFMGAACAASLYRAPIVAKHLDWSGRAWEPWRGPHEAVPYPAYVLQSSVGRACLVDSTAFNTAIVGGQFTCEWRYAIKQNN